MTETNRIEFKRELTDKLDIEKEVIAFLNYREGGIIYIGIEKNGTAVGLKDIDGDMLKIKDRIRKNISPSPMGLFDVTATTIDNKRVIKIFIASGNEKPYYKTKYGMSEHGCYIRVGTAAEPMTTAMIEDLFSHRVRNSLKNIPSPRQDLTFSQLRIYYQEKGFSLNDNFLKTLELLTDNEQMNYAAYLLADENGNSMKFAEYAGTDRYELVENNEYGYCCLLTATRKILDKLNVANKVRSTITPTSRIDTPLWDPIALREVVVNAIVHNDYSYGAPAKIELFSDHIEITSIGRIPEGLSETDFFSGISMPRNKELMRVFRDVDLVEALGSGMLRIMHSYNKENFEFGDNYIRFKVYFNKASETVNVLDNNRNVLDNHTLNILSDTNITRQEKLIALIRINPKSTIKLLSQQLNVSPKTIQRDLEIFKSEGKIKHIGSDNSGEWVIMSEDSNANTNDNEKS